ncbi:uncharacterized protein N7515_000028 [Penicillium bovifimosum]|uniref:Uncharacterized protein n=1 Tax=Penicillium bovifimosum TaxID=126998 RepID=A0A9W9L9I6_9EURO|nr:uncharacterized protein N7515_000028 [Penicillium bovifimosum]KAJ5145464.1 hypothetical protein N7515_000028 [Penicillium bovifimosum]
MLLIPFLGICLGMTLWSQWLPIPGVTVPEMSFRERLSGAVQLTLGSWIVYDTVDTLMSQRPHSGDTAVVSAVVNAVVSAVVNAVVSVVDGHGYANTTDFLVISPVTDVMVPLTRADTMPSWFPTGVKVPIPGLAWCSVGVTTSLPEEVVDIHPLKSGPGQGLFVPLLCVVVWCFVQGPMALIAYTRRFVSFVVRTLAERILGDLEGQPQIARVQLVAEEDSTLYDKLDFLIAGLMDLQDETLAWVLAVDSRPDSVSHVSVLSHAGGIWVHRIRSEGEQARDRKSARDTTTNGTGSGCQLPGNPPGMDAFKQDDASASAEVLNAKGADIEGDGSPQKRKRKNRPSQAKRRRFKRRLLEASEKELEQALFRSRYTSRGVPLSALAPVFVPTHLAEQERQSGPLSSAPVSMQIGIDPPDDCGTGAHDNGVPPQRSFRRRRHRKRKA